MMAWVTAFKVALSSAFIYLSTAVIGIDSQSGPAVKCSKYDETVDAAAARDNIKACLTDYHSQLEYLDQTNQKFFTGVDVEVIRSVCSSLQSSIGCIQTIRDSCPTTEHLLESVLSPHVTVLELCLHKNLYEDYAMNQRCFSDHQQSSENCYNDFLSSVEDPRSVAPYSRAYRTALHQYCSQLKHLVGCVKSNIKELCRPNKIAAKLVDVLVRASVNLSEQCVDEHLTTLKPSRLKGSAPVEDNSRVVNSAPTSVLHRLNLLTVAVLPFVLTLRPCYLH